MRKPLALAAALALAVAACKHAPYTGRKQLLLTSAPQEEALGLQAYDQVLKENKLSKDAAASAMVKRVGERIAKAASRPDFKWEFNLIDDPKQVNAFCLPGGKVAVYSGILPVTRDEAGLAVVMGHEVAHALARHGGERMSQSLLAQAGGAALSVMMAEKPAETQQMAMTAYGLGAAVGVLLPFSRSHESEADRIGLILMAQAGYDPSAAVDFWTRMKEKSKGAAKPPEFLSTHPADDTRIEDIKKRIPEAREAASHKTVTNP
jgi:metalloendopeptidase OMA1, mitochondrial